MIMFRVLRLSAISFGGAFLTIASDFLFDIVQLCAEKVYTLLICSFN